MGIINSVTCKNKQCRYHIELREGPGMIGFAHMKQFEKSIVEGNVNNPDVKERLEKGAKMETRGIYLCPCCKEFKNDDTYFLIENITESPFGTIRYDVRFPFGKPICEKCNSELIYIENIRSSKVKCPKCGSDLNARLSGYVD